MAKDPWKGPDPQPGDFDAELDQAQVDPRGQCRRAGEAGAARWPQCL